MTNCEQFIYTAAKTKRVIGYQVISKSKGISEKIISECSNYLYPLGIKHKEFTEARSLVIINKNKIAFSIVKNIGVGFDGRPGTIYSHTFVMDKTDFQKIDNDTRIFEMHYLEDPNRQRILPSFTLESKKLPLDFKLLDKIMPVLPNILLNLIRGKKTAIVKTSKHDLIQNILTILPPSLRLISFSSLVNQPHSQPKYDFILTPKPRIISEEFQKIDPFRVKPIKKSNNLLESSIRYLLYLIHLREIEQLSKIYKEFEKIPGKGFENKLILVTNYAQFVTTNNEKIKQKFADNIVTVIKKMDEKTAHYYLGKVKKYSKQYAILENQIQSFIDPSVPLIDALLLLPARATLNILSSYTDFQNNLRKLLSKR